MFAGQMRLRTFLLLGGTALVLGGGVFGAAVVSGVFAWRASSEVTAPVVPAPVAVAPVATAPRTAVVDASVPTAAGAREADTVVLDYLGKPLGTDKKKDVTSGRAYKVNVYQDAGQSVANRAKLDLDRDDKWDEKFTWKDGVITREVAPSDDEAYSARYTWTGGAWSAAP